jgi:hypothetical protein
MGYLTRWSLIASEWMIVYPDFDKSEFIYYGVSLLYIGVVILLFKLSVILLSFWGVIISVSGFSIKFLSYFLLKLYISGSL